MEHVGKLAKGYTIADIADMKGVATNYAVTQLRKGIKVEMEHTDDKRIAEAIAKDHLFEDIEYYKKLEKMEADANEVGGNFRMPNLFGSYTSVKVMPVDENLRPSKDYFTVQVEVRSKTGEEDVYIIQPKPLKTFPISKYNDFMQDLLQRGATKYEVGGKVVSKGDNHPADAKKGGFFKGRAHSEGGIKAVNISSNQPIEVEGGEVIITKPAVEDDTKREFEGEMLTNREILSRINQSGGGVPIFSDGGDIASHTCGCSGKTYNYGGRTMTDAEILQDMARSYTYKPLISGFSFSKNGNNLYIHVPEEAQQSKYWIPFYNEMTKSRGYVYNDDDSPVFTKIEEEYGALDIEGDESIIEKYFPSVMLEQPTDETDEFDNDLINAQPLQPEPMPTNEIILPASGGSVTINIPITFKSN